MLPLGCLELEPGFDQDRGWVIFATPVRFFQELVAESLRNLLKLLETNRIRIGRFLALSQSKVKSAKIRSRSTSPGRDL